MTPFDIRPLDVADSAHVDAAARIAVQSDLDCIGWTDETRESVLSSLTSPDAWPEQHRLVWQGEEPVGYLMAELDRAGREVFLDAYGIGPDAQEIQRSLLVSGIAVAREVAAADLEAHLPAGADLLLLSEHFWQVVAACWQEDHGYRGVLEELGFRTIRRFWRMALDLADRSTAEPPAPAGVTRRVAAGEADRRTLYELWRDSFAEHFGSHDRPFEEWIAVVESSPGVDPSRWWVADLDGVPAGICLLDDSRAEFGEGYVRTLGVRASARGRGIGRWLLECAAADAVARGRTGLALGVDGENTTGATALYESVGFVIRQVIDVWCYPLSDSASSR